MLLAIDTATQFASIALYDASGLRGEDVWHSADNHTAELMPAIARLLDKVGLTPQGLTAVAVSLGPGSFSGLRVGLSATKGLAFALGIPILGVPTLDALAYSQAGESFPVWAIVQAGRGRICAAMYRVASGWPERVGEYRLGKIDLVVDSTDEPCVLCGEIEPSEADMLRLRLGPRLARIAIEAAPRRAVYVAELAWARLQRGESDDLASLAPIYLPQPSVI